MKGGLRMSYRTPAGSKDEAIFRRTAVRTKNINLIAKPTRGGIRL